MKYLINSFIFLLSSLSFIIKGQETIQVINGLIGQKVIIPLLICPRRASASYTENIKPDETILKFVKTVWLHFDNATSLALEYSAIKKGITYSKFSLHLNAQPSPGTKWFIIDIK